jgi:hypothetical protein
MRNLIVILGLLISTNILSQNIPQTRIDYSNFDKKLFDSIFLEEVNLLRSVKNETTIIFDSVCYKSANYLSRYLTTQETFDGYIPTQFDGIFLPTSNDRFEFANTISGISKYDEKKLENESVFAVYIGLDSKTFTYNSLVKFLIKESLNDLFTESINLKFNNIEVFGAISSEVKQVELGYKLVVTNVIALK